MRRPGRTGPKGRDAIEEMAERLEALTDVLRETLSAAPAGTEGSKDRQKDRDAAPLDADTVRAMADIEMRIGGLVTSSVQARDADEGQGGARRSGGVTPRIPDHEVEDDGTIWQLTVDLPGIAPDECSLSLVGGEIRIETSGQRSYALGVKVPHGHDPSSLSHHHALGVLQVTLARHVDRETGQ